MRAKDKQKYKIKSATKDLVGMYSFKYLDGTFISHCTEGQNRM